MSGSLTNPNVKIGFGILLAINTEVVIFWQIFMEPLSTGYVCKIHSKI